MLTSDGQGGSTESWVDIPEIPEVWAKIRPRSSKERYFSQQTQPITSHEIIIRWRDDLNERMRIVYEGRIFQIKGKFREDEERWFVFIDAEEGVGS